MKRSTDITTEYLFVSEVAKRGAKSTRGAREDQRDGCKERSKESSKVKDRSRGD